MGSKLQLTPERERIIRDAAEEWLRVGRSTAPADFLKSAILANLTRLQSKRVASRTNHD